MTKKPDPQPTDGSQIFVVVWSGGYEAASYKLEPTRKAAFEQAQTWMEDWDEDEGDTIDVLRIDLAKWKIERETFDPGTWTEV